MKKFFEPFRKVSRTAEPDFSKDEHSDKVNESSHKTVLLSDLSEERRNGLEDEEKKTDDSSVEKVASGSRIGRKKSIFRKAISLIDRQTDFASTQCERDRVRQSTNSLLTPGIISKGNIIKRSRTPPSGAVPTIVEDARNLQTALVGIFMKQLSDPNPTAHLNSDMENGQSNQSEEEKQKQLSQDFGVGDHNGSKDIRDEVEAPFPNTKHIISEQLPPTASESVMENESKRKNDENGERLNELELSSRLGDSSKVGNSFAGVPNGDSLSELTANGDSEEKSENVSEMSYGGSGVPVGKAEDESVEAIRKRQYVIRELIDTEQDYVRDLKEIVEGYLAITRDPDGEIPMPENLREGRDKIVFGNIEAIYEWHRDMFSRALDECNEHPENLGPLFKKYERKFLMYVVYCKNKPISEFIVTEHIDTYFEEIRQKLGHQLNLCDFLIKPVQRIMKYKLLLNDILKYTEKIGQEAIDEIRMLKQATHLMHVVPKEANDMMNVSRLQGFDGKIAAQGKLLMLGPLICSEGTSAVNFKGKELQVFFFQQSVILSDVVGKKTLHSNPVYIYKAHIEVNKLVLTERVNDGDPCKFALRSNDHGKAGLSFVCQAASKENRAEWITQLKLILQTQNDFVKAIQSPIQYQNNKLMK